MAMAPLQNMPGGRIPLEIAGVHEVELLDVLGVGGFGVMWKVKDTSTGTLYALKIIQNIKPDGIHAERVRLEAEVSIPSAHIIRVIGLREWDSSTFLILFEYFRSTALDDLLKKKSLTGEQKKNIFIQTLKGVADAHRHNVIHRDIKPSNILVSEDGTAKLIDFGISKFKGTPITKSGDVIGTFPYMAPELFRFGSRAADARCDIYSLGQTLYELAMGQCFWTHKGWVQLEDIISYLNQVPPPVEGVEMDEFFCDFLPDAHNILARMVKFAPEERYQHVDEILDEIGEDSFSPIPLPLDMVLRHPVLIIESGPNRFAQRVLSLHDGEKLSLGRYDLAGADTSISRSHLKITRHGDNYFVQDLDSKNGTLVQGIMLQKDSSPVAIHHGDRIKIGDIFLRFAFLK